MVGRLIIFIAFLFTVSFGNAQPIPVYSIGDADPLPQKGAQNCATCLLTTNLLKHVSGEEFALLIQFKGPHFELVSFPRQYFSVTFNYPYFTFTTSAGTKDKTERRFYKFDLTGTGPRSYDYYNDGNWHQVLFNFSNRLGKREIWADGVLLNETNSTFPPAKNILKDASDAFKGPFRIKQLKLFGQFLDARQIQALNKELPANKQTANLSNSLDTLQFAPGFPRYSISLTEQLRQFPAPRFAKGHQLFRNVSWMDINYLSERNPAAAVDIETEMYERWNYLLDIPLLPVNEKIASRLYSDKNTVPGAVLELAKRKPHWKYAVTTFQAQVQPSHAGFNSDRPFVTSQQLKNSYYLSDKNGKPLIIDGRKRLSPLADKSIMEQDAATIRFYLAQLNKHLDRPPALISENGEVLGTAYRESLLMQDPKVWKDYKRSRLSRTQYFGKFQSTLETAFRNEMLIGLPASTLFSIFQVSAVQPDFWGDYSYRRKINRLPDGTVRSTPDFYPYTPSNWQLATGAYNGYGTIAKGRATEIRLGDKNFSPFIAAGWMDEKNNIRPAQWLALLKSMVMLGADFFYVGYFNITNPDGKWPGGAGPNDPKGYAYQVAIPAYAQAIRTHTAPFFEEGRLLNADSSFRFSGTSPNDLILVRKWKDEWLIYGSIQPNSNLAGSVPDIRQTTIQLEGKKIRFPIRRQGSMYLLKGLDSESPTLSQLDAWHEVAHPYFWSQHLSIEAENMKLLEGTSGLLTTTSATLDFSGFTTCRLLTPGDRLQYDFEGATSKDYQTMELISTDDSNQEIELEWTIGNNKGSWKGYPRKSVIRIQGKGTVELLIKKGQLKLDKILLKQ